MATPLGDQVTARLSELLEDLRAKTREASSASDASQSVEMRLSALYEYTLASIGLLSDVATAGMVAISDCDLPDSTRARIEEMLRPLPASPPAG